MSVSGLVYVTVGNHDQPFDRLIAEMDTLAQRHGFELVMQTGCSGYRPARGEARPFFPRERAEELVRAATAVVGHAGIGTVISARRHGTPLVICPRRRARGEHFNDHQAEICGELSREPRPGVAVAPEPGDIETPLMEFLRAGRRFEPATPGEGIRAALREFIAAP